MIKFFKSKTLKYTDVAMVEGILKGDKSMEKVCYHHCKKYFNQYYRGVFFVDDEYKDDIFQDAFVALWDNILRGKLYVEDGLLKGKGGRPFTSSLTTYLMEIARRKYLNLSRKNSPLSYSTEETYTDNPTEEDDDDIMWDAIFSCLAKLPKRCNQILTLFYYEMKSLDDIMIELTTFKSKDALKTAKHKCLTSLRKEAQEMYYHIINT